MAGKDAKIATVIIKVDLECSCCSKKIKCALCKVQKRFKINTIVFDEKTTVTVSGAFNPDCFIKEICCLAYKVIKDIQIKPEPPKKPTTPEDKPKPKPTPPPEVDVKISIMNCCCQPCPCYQPNQGCYRCCSCGHESSAQPCLPQCTKPCPPPCHKPCPEQCPKRCPQQCPNRCPQQCYKIVCEEEPWYGCSIM